MIGWGAQRGLLAPARCKPNCLPDPRFSQRPLNFASHILGSFSGKNSTIGDQFCMVRDDIGGGSTLEPTH